MRKVKKALLAIVFVLGLTCEALSQEVDSIACKKVEDTLHLLQAFLENPNSDTSLRRVGAVYFLQNLTRINSASRVTFVGPEFPTKEDYNKWMAWYKANRNELRYNKRNNQVFVSD